MPQIRPVHVAGVAAALAVCALLTGCVNLHTLGLKHQQEDYAHWADSPKTGPTAVPTFVPHDASNVYLRTLLDGSGAAITYTSNQPVDTSACVAGPLTGKPRLDSNWWPDRKPPATGLVCPGGWQVFQRNGATYGWRNTP